MINFSSSQCLFFHFSIFPSPLSFRFFYGFPPCTPVTLRSFLISRGWSAYWFVAMTPGLISWGINKSPLSSGFPCYKVWFTNGNNRVNDRFDFVITSSLVSLFLFSGLSQTFVKRSNLVKVFVELPVKQHMSHNFSLIFLL